MGLDTSLRRLTLAVRELEKLAADREASKKSMQIDMFAPLAIQPLPQRPELASMTQTIDRAIDRIETVLRAQRKT